MHYRNYMNNTYYELPKLAQKKCLKLKGPILIIGAGGFIGFNLLLSLLTIRDDVFGVSRNPENNWRFKRLKLPNKNILQCDLQDAKATELLIKKINPQTIFNLAAYGAYARQKNILQIYKTNFIS